jgi:hypothetical protein
MTVSLLTCVLSARERMEERVCGVALLPAKLAVEVCLRVAKLPFGSVRGCDREFANKQLWMNAALKQFSRFCPSLTKNEHAMMSSHHK